MIGLPAIAGMQTVANGPDEFFRIDGFVQILNGPGIHRFQIGVDFTVSGQNDDGEILTGQADLLEEAQAVALRHPEITDDKIELGGTQEVQSFRNAIR